jgi:gliding motility-associated-like protein
VAGTILTSTQTVTLTADDGNGNVSSCSFDVLPVDTIAPTISCPADIIVDSDPGLCGAIVNFTPPIGTDNCTGATTVQLAGLPSGSLYPIGITTTTFQVTDAANNVATCSFNVVVTDSEAPSITCPAAIFTCDSIISFGDPVISDNCIGASYELSTGIASGNRFPVGLTTNIYTVTDASGNQASCPVEITRYPLPTIDAGSDQQIDAGKATLITTNSSKVEHFKWTPFTGLDDPTIAAPLASPQQTTEYTVTVTSADGCTATDDVKIMVNLVIEANNFMSPNGDGKNDTWIIKGNYLLDECTIQLFDSWGNLVFEKRGYANDWDGNGLPEGVYYYVISCGDQPTKSGSITLIR